MFGDGLEHCCWTNKEPVSATNGGGLPSISSICALFSNIEAPAFVAGDTLGQYLSEVKRIPRLTLDEEHLLAKWVARARFEKQQKPCCRQSVEVLQSGSRAFEILVIANLRLTISIARKYAGYGVPLLDLIQEGNLGLMEAVEHFDGDRGTRFGTCATWWIRREISRALAAQSSSSYRLPEKAYVKARKIALTTRSLEQTLEREPTSLEIAVAAELAPQSVHSLSQSIQPAVSLEQLLQSAAHQMEDLSGEDSPFTLVSQQQMVEHLAQALSCLSPREQLILALRFGLIDGEERPKSIVGKQLGVSRQRIGQIEADAMTSLRENPFVQTLRTFLS